MIRFGRRRRFLIDPLQYKLLGINLAYLTVVIFLFLVAVFFPAILSLYRESTFEQSVAASTEFLSLHKRIWPAVPVALVLVSVHSILVSHRIAGPLYRFRNVFDRVKRGDLSVRAGVRDKDYLQKEANTINSMIDGLIENVSAIAQGATETREAYWSVHSLVTEEHRPGLTDAMTRLDSRLGELEERIRRFQLAEANKEVETPDPETTEEVDRREASEDQPVGAPR